MMQWEPAGQIRVNNVIALINRAVLDNGNVFHSIRISHLDETNIEGKPNQYLRPSDLDDLEELAKQTRYWIQADIDEIRNPPKKKKAPPQETHPENPTE